MSKGILYIMITSVEGLIKIGKTQDFNKRMTILEQNGYWNVSGLKRFFAVKVDDYDEKEKLIHTVFSKSQVANSELFALDKFIAKDMLEAFEGEQIYPEVNEVKKENVEHRTNRKASTFESLNIPIGSELVYIKDPSIKVKVYDDKNLIQHTDDTIKSVSGMVKYIEQRDFPVNGNKCFMYNGKSLWDIRNELENK